jgi:hypothetical protein
LLKGELEFEVNGFGKTNVNWTWIEENVMEEMGDGKEMGDKQNLCLFICKY